jgi:anti-sigma factor RsiW
MADDHFSRQTILRFLQSELSKDETREFVRHLLRQCPECSQLVREVTQRQDFRFLIRDLEDSALRCDPEPYQRILRRTLRLVEQEEARAGPRAESDSRASLR